jgi:hypothetical protein
MPECLKQLVASPANALPKQQIQKLPEKLAALRRRYAHDALPLKPGETGQTL